MWQGDPAAPGHPFPGLPSSQSVWGSAGGSWSSGHHGRGAPQLLLRQGPCFRYLWLLPRPWQPPFLWSLYWRKVHDLGQKQTQRRDGLSHARSEVLPLFLLLPVGTHTLHWVEPLAGVGFRLGDSAWSSGLAAPLRAWALGSLCPACAWLRGPSAPSRWDQRPESGAGPVPTMQKLHAPPLFLPTSLPLKMVLTGPHGQGQQRLRPTDPGTGTCPTFP